MIIKLFLLDGNIAMSAIAGELLGFINIFNLRAIQAVKRKT